MKEDFDDKAGFLFMLPKGKVFPLLQSYFDQNEEFKKNENKSIRRRIMKEKKNEDDKHTLTKEFTDALPRKPIGVTPPPWNTAKNEELTAKYIEVMQALYKYGYDLKRKNNENTNKF